VLIVTVTLNPAVDHTIYINNFAKDEVNQIEYSVKDPGGKGINVSKALKNLGCDNIAMGLIGGETGKYIEDYLKEIGLTTKFNHISGETRTNIKIVDLLSGETTDVNEKGTIVNNDELEIFMETYSKTLNKGDVVVVAGSIPKTLDNQIYRKLVEVGNEHGCKMILDARGDLLKEGIKGKPFLIKPNKAELEEILGEKLNDRKGIIKACRQIITGGVEYVCLSMGSQGALLVSKDNVYYSTPINVKVRSTVGAGDSLVAGIVAGYFNEMPMIDAFRLGIASAVVSVTKEGTKAPSYDEVIEFFNKVNVYEEM